MGAFCFAVHLRKIIVVLPVSWPVPASDSCLPWRQTECGGHAERRDFGGADTLPRRHARETRRWFCSGRPWSGVRISGLGSSSSWAKIQRRAVSVFGRTRFPLPIHPRPFPFLAFLIL